MNSYMTRNNPSSSNTYELESRRFNGYIPYNSSRNTYNTINKERLSNSPPIILCETNNSKQLNNKNKHVYLFYPSISRLSPFSDSMANYSIINSNSRNNNFDSQRDMANKLRDDNQFINSETPRYDNQSKEGETNNNFERKKGNRSQSTGFPKDTQKYQALFDKTFELMKTLSDVIPDEEAKIKGDSSYYYSRDKDYEKIINKQKDFLTNYFKSAQLSRTGSDIYKDKINNASGDLVQICFFQDMLPQGFRL